MFKCLAILIALATSVVAQNGVPVQQSQGVPGQNQQQQQHVPVQQQQQVPVQQQQQVPVQQQQVPVQQQQVPVQQQQVPVQQQQVHVPQQQQVPVQQQQVPMQQQHQVHVQQQQIPVQQQVHVQQQHQQMQQEQINMNQDHGMQGHGRNIMRDKNHIQDREHMMHDLDGVIDFGTLQGEMTEEEIHFHYFKLHDTDHNNRLDGLEIFQAISHYDTSKDAHPEIERKVLPEEEIEELVNAVLEEDDVNGDGYVDYPEFSKSLIEVTA